MSSDTVVSAELVDSVAETLISLCKTIHDCMGQESSGELQDPDTYTLLGEARPNNSHIRLFWLAPADSQTHCTQKYDLKSAIRSFLSTRPDFQHETLLALTKVADPGLSNSPRTDDDDNVCNVGVCAPDLRFATQNMIFVYGPEKNWRRCARDTQWLLDKSVPSVEQPCESREPAAEAAESEAEE